MSEKVDFVACACGDEYQVNSYGAGFMAANNGVCENCDAAQPVEAEGAEVVAWRYKHREESYWRHGATEQNFECSEPLMTVAQHIAALSAVTAERDRLRGLLREASAVAITMLYDSHKADVLAEFSVAELEAVVKASEHLHGVSVESVYRRAWDAAMAEKEGA